MSLIDIFGRTDELSIIDFLTSNPDYDYTVTGLKDYLNEGSNKWFSEFEIEHLLTKLIYNGIVVEVDNGRPQKSFALAKNNMTKCINGLAFSNSKYIAEKPCDDEDIELKEIQKKVFNE